LGLSCRVGLPTTNWNRCLFHGR